jgi:CRISPR-associated exonuclease Cas4
MFPDDDLIPLSALQHLLFCERQCALIHVEGLWAENVLTLEGRHLHRRVHESESQGGPDVRITRGLPLLCQRLGLTGKADVVEFRRVDEASARSPDLAAQCLRLPGREGAWQVVPVEYKRGRPKRAASDRIQLCAQALCLEEMLGVVIPAGAIFYGRIRRRTPVTFDPDLRMQTEEAVARVRWLIRSGTTPPAIRQKKCQRCSWLHLCLPKVTASGGDGRSATRYFQRMLASMTTGPPPTEAGGMR